MKPAHEKDPGVQPRSFVRTNRSLNRKFPMRLARHARPQKHHGQEIL